MKIKKRILIYLLAVILVFLLGSWAYQEVAIKYRPPSPDEIQDQKDAEQDNSQSESSPKKFESEKDSVLTFNYPSDWKEEEVAVEENVKDSVINALAITNFAKNTELSGGFPINGVRIDIIDYKLDPKLKKTSIINCEMKSTTCTQKVINGTTFQTSTATLNTGFVTKTLGVDTKSHRVIISVLAGTGPKQNENLEKIENMINTIQIKK